MPAVERVYNFSSGPAVLPLPVLEQVQRDLVALPGVGMSVMEISHRSSTFEAIIGQAEADIRRLAGVPDGYRVLFLQGGASLQFSMVPMNLLTEGTTADYINTGSWAEKAVKEAKRVGNVHVTGLPEGAPFDRIPTDAECEFTPGAAYVHMTSNNTIEGTQWHRLPQSGDAPLVNDASSDIFSGPVDISKYGLDLRRRAEEPGAVRRGARHHPRGPAGTVHEVAPHDAELRGPGRERLAVQHAAGVRGVRPGPRHAVAAGAGRPAGDRRRQRAQGRQAVRRAGPDRVLATHRPGRQPEPDERHVPDGDPRTSSRSFIKESTAAGFDGLKGHRSVGGMRASIYNAFPEAGVDALIEFMRDFERRNG